MEGICRAAPFGGEAIWPEEGYETTLTETVTILRRLHLSYLNCQHDARLLKRWQEQTMRQKGVWKGVSLYDYIGAHMGYRFCVRRAAIRREGDWCRLFAEIENTGFGNLLQEAQAELLWIGAAGERQSELLDWDARQWHSGSRVICQAVVPVRSGKPYLRLWRKWDQSRILFANKTESHWKGDGERGEYISIEGSEDALPGRQSETGCGI